MPASKQVSYTYTTTVKLLAFSYNGAAVLRSAVLETLNRLNTQGIAQSKVTRKKGTTATWFGLGFLLGLRSA